MELKILDKRTYLYDQVQEDFVHLKFHQGKSDVLDRAASKIHFQLKNIFKINFNSYKVVNITLISTLAYLKCYDFPHYWRQFDPSC